MGSATLASRLTRIAAGGMLYSVLTNAMIYVGQIIIARELPRTDYANFSVLVSLISLIAMFADLGWTPYLVKRFAQSEAESLRGTEDIRGQLLGTALLLKAIIAAAAAIVGVVVAFALYGQNMGVLFIIATATFFVSSRMMVFRTVMESFLRAEGGFDKVLRLAAIDATAFAILLVIWSQIGLSLFAVVAIYSFCHLPGFCFLLQAVRNSVVDKGIRVSFNGAAAKETFARALPLTIGVWFLTMHSMADTLILERLSNHYQVSAFAASFRLMAALSFLPGLIAGVVIPDIIKMLKQELPERAVKLASFALQSLLTIAVLMALLISSLAPYLVDIILGQQYSDAGPLVVIFGWMFLPIVFASFMLELGVAVDKQKVFGYYTFVLALVTIIGDVIVAKPYGASGVILVKFAAIILGCVVLTSVCRKEHTMRNVLSSIKWRRNLVSILAPLALLALAMFFNVPAVVAGLITTLVFLTWSIKTDLIDVERLVSMLRSLRKG
jgi:O-antigen/teichoic acid export membrane protein